MSLQRRLIKLLGYEEQQKKVEEKYTGTEPCEGCGESGTAYVRLVIFKSLKQLGYCDDWANDGVFLAHLCKLCFLLWREHDTAWTKEYVRRHGGSYKEARSIRGAEYVKVAEKMSDRVQEIERVRREYEQRISSVVIHVGEKLPSIEGIVTYIDAVPLRSQKALVVYVIDSENV